MVDENLNIGTVIIAVALTVVLMSGIFFFGIMLSDEKVSGIEDEIRSFEVERRSQEISRQVAQELPEKSCEALELAVEQTISDTQELADEVVMYEENRKIEDEEFELLKKEYTNVLLEYWLLTEQIEEMCGSDKIKLLYFYSEEQECPACEDQGTIISHYREKYDETLLVFPMDTTLDMRPINIMEETYDMGTYPVIKINGDVYEGYMDKEELGEVLEEYIEE